MKTIFGLGRPKRKFRNPIIALGVFDGVHLGHQFLLKKVVSQARRLSGTSIVVTFYPHPSHVLNLRSELPLLISLKERLRLFSELGIDISIVIRFSPVFSKIKAEDFIRKYLVPRLHPKEIYIGKDFVFGSDQKGTVGLLIKDGKQYGFKVKAIPPQKISGKVISSTLIRSLMKKDNLLGVSKLLNRPAAISGKVIIGARKGVALGFPTANIKRYAGILPREGVYAVRVNYKDKRYFGMAFIGRRPKFITSDRSQSLEVNIFDFNTDIHGENIEVEFWKKIRNTRIFTDEASLITQLKNDCQAVKRLVKSPFFMP